MINKKELWDNVFASKTDDQKSWYEEFPHASMKLITELKVAKNSSIIDIGGGDSHLVDALLQRGYKDISVLDISKNALQNSKRRLGKDAGQVNWVVCDVLNFNPQHQFDLWHDRAVFHFFTDEKSITGYLDKMIMSIKEGGSLILATFSDNGPEKCSGLPVKKYSQKTLTELLEPYFQKIKCIEERHTTPFNTLQPFTFCGFKKI